MTTTISITERVSPEKAKTAIRKCMSINRPIFLWGPPGVGKSDIVKQLGDDSGRNVIDVRLSLWEPTDIKGIPYYDPEKKTMVWASPDELPKLFDDTSILFLDEMNSAVPATQAAAFQLILNRRIGQYVLPPGVSIVAAGNREGDKGVTHRMPAPLKNRFIHLEVEANYDDWLLWATGNDQPAQVISYLEYAKQDLYAFDPKSPETAFATPRTWSMVSDLVRDDDLDDSVLHTLVAGSIGAGLAAKFMAHRKIVGLLPKPEDVLDGTATTFAVKEISAMYSMVISCCYELQSTFKRSDDKYVEKFDNFLLFMMNNMPAELVVTGMRMVAAKFKLNTPTQQLKHFNRFNKEHGGYVLAAMGAK